MHRKHDRATAATAIRISAAIPAALLTLAVLLTGLLATTVHAERIKDLANVQGVRSNDLVGYGLVVGLNGTGDSSNSSPYTISSINAMLERFGINVRSQIATMKPKNIAAVMVTATLPAFARPGQKLDITVSSMGDAKACAAARCCWRRCWPATTRCMPWPRAPCPWAVSRPAAMPRQKQ